MLHVATEGPSTHRGLSREAPADDPMMRYALVLLMTGLATVALAAVGADAAPVDSGEFWLRIAERIGFPAVVALVLLFRLDKSITANTAATSKMNVLLNRLLGRHDEDDA